MSEQIKWVCVGGPKDGMEGESPATTGMLHMPVPVHPVPELWRYDITDEMVDERVVFKPVAVTPGRVDGQYVTFEPDDAVAL